MTEWEALYVTLALLGVVVVAFAIVMGQSVLDERGPW